MLSNIKRKMRKDEEEGFTLIELLVVVLILGILMAIAIPTFLSLTGGAKTSAAEADLTTAAQDEAAYLTTNGVFDAGNASTAALNSAANVTAMIAADAGINWVAAAPGAAGTKSVSVAVTSNTSAAPTLYLETLAADGNSYWIKDASGTLTYSQSSKTTFVYPAVTGAAFVTSWKGLPSTVAAN